MNRPDRINGVPIPFDDSLAALRARIAGGAPRAAAFEALALHPSSEALAILVEASGSADPHVRRLAVESIGRRADGRESARVVLALLGDPAGFVVRSACETAARLKLSEAQDALVRLATTGEAPTREAALLALPASWRDADFPRVLEAWRTAGTKALRTSAARALSGTLRPERARQLWDAWHSANDAWLRAESCRIAEILGDASLLPRLRVLARDDDGHVRKAATRAIAALHG